MSKDVYLTDTLPKLLRILQGSDVRELELEEGDIRVRVHRSPTEFVDGTVEASARDDMPPPFSSPTILVRATVVGTFYRAGRPGMAPLVSEGSHVQDSTIIGIIEALHVLTDVEAGYTGVVTAVLATDGQPVEYNQPLLEIQLDG